MHQPKGNQKDEKKNPRNGPPVWMYVVSIVLPPAGWLLAIYLLHRDAYENAMRICQTAFAAFIIIAVIVVAVLMVLNFRAAY